jgi:hypothetical protein
MFCLLLSRSGEGLRRKEKSTKMNKNMPNKAKFQNAKNEHKSLFHNDYEQQTTNNELLKTKPNKANFPKQGRQ